MGNSTIQYKEYNMWCQLHKNVELDSVCIKSESDIPSFITEECRRGIERLYGDIVSDSSDYSVRIVYNKELRDEGCRLKGKGNEILIEGGGYNGLLYGVYALIRHLRLDDRFGDIDEEHSPAVDKRVINHWDNMTGDIERGYAGESIFFKQNQFDYDKDRIKEYARFLATIGINQLSINNVNVTPQSAKLITEEFLPEVEQLAAIFRPYGIRLLLTVDFEAPIIFGGFHTSDPLDEGVAKWWKAQTELVYQYIPDLAGFVVKADSEFRKGPAALGRTQADGANVIAAALKPHEGVVYWRCFVYNCQQDWRDQVTDRPKAAYEQFKPLDGIFTDNVILQIKQGPVDFQVREPNSPLLSELKATRKALELQITQEYTGQQIDLYALPVQWEEIYDTPVNQDMKTRELLGQGIEAICAVSNIGNDENWTGHTLAQLNLFAMGRMAFQPELTAKDVIDEWVRLTFGNDPQIRSELTMMLMQSRETYEKYTAPLGIGFMVNIHHHYGPSVDGYEYMKWGTYHRANHKEIGVDRTSMGTGYTKQYHPWLTKIYDNRETCPQELLLFFHRLPYDYLLHSGKTLLQHIYDTHFEGAEEVEEFIKVWDSLKTKLPESAYESVRERFLRQLDNAKEWRDVINSYFYRKTGIADEQSRKIYE